jgi:hypothetical protein
MDPNVKDLILLSTDAELILQECKDLKLNLSVELRAVRDDRKRMFREFNEFMSELQRTLDQMRAKHLIEAGLLDLIRPTGENEECQRSESENRSSHCRTLDVLSRKTH